MADLALSNPAVVTGTSTITFTAITANTSATFTIGSGLIPKSNRGFPLVSFRAALDAGIILAQPPWIDISATGVTTIKVALANITAGDLTPTAQVTDWAII